MYSPQYAPLLSTGETITLTLTEMLTYEETGGSSVDNYIVEVYEVDSWSEVNNSLDL